MEATLALNSVIEADLEFLSTEITDVWPYAWFLWCWGSHQGFVLTGYTLYPLSLAHSPLESALFHQLNLSNQVSVSPAPKAYEETVLKGQDSHLLVTCPPSEDAELTDDNQASLSQDTQSRERKHQRLMDGGPLACVEKRSL